MSEDELKENFIKALSAMPAENRTALFLYEAHDLSLAEVAEVEEVDIKIAKGRIFYGRMLLRERLTDFFDDQFNYSGTINLKDPAQPLPPDPAVKSLVKKILLAPAAPAEYQAFIRAYQAHMERRSLWQRVKTLIFPQENSIAAINSRPRWSPVLLAVGSIIITGLTAVLIYQIIYQNNNNFVAINSDPKISPQPTITPIATPTPSPTPTVQPTVQPTIKPSIRDPKNSTNGNNPRPDPHRPFNQRGVENGDNQTEIAALRSIYIDNLGDEPADRQLRDELIAQFTARSSLMILNSSAASSSNADAILKRSLVQSDIIILISNDGNIIWKKSISPNTTPKQLATSIVNSILAKTANKDSRH